MQPLSVVLLQSNPAISQSLTGSLGKSFHCVYEVQSLCDLRNSIAKNRAAVAIVDMELAPISEVEMLARDFPGICVVCTHRLADEEMWAAALNAGATDICPSDDTRSILTAVMRNAPAVRAFAA
jgi:DNA-binding NarL/FixJ family response regulator